MNRNKILALAIISLFFVGISMGSVTAAHTFKWGKYQGTMSNADYNLLKEVYNGESDYGQVQFTLKTKNYKKIKIPIYKNKKIKKYKWVYKYKKYSKTSFYENGDVDYDYYYPKTPKGYKKCGSSTKWNSQHTVATNYFKYKKRVAYYATKKVRTGKYKTKKTPICLMVVSNNVPYAYIQPYYIDGHGMHIYMGRKKSMNL